MQEQHTSMPKAGDAVPALVHVARKADVGNGAADSMSPRTLPTACATCRFRHLKCDRLQPCNRCQSTGQECSYIASRRGYKRRRSDSSILAPDTTLVATLPNKDGQLPFASVPSPATGPISPVYEGISRAYGQVSPLFGCSGTLTPGSPAPAHNALIEAANNGVHLNPLRRQPLLWDDACLNSYYTNIHPSHPFVLPKMYLHQLVEPERIEPLLYAMRWVGSLYLPSSPKRDALFQKAFQKVHDPNVTQDAFLVQAMMVLIIGLDGTRQLDMSKKLLFRAEELATKLHLNTRAFAALHGQNAPVMEESWRRTWWDLYVVDGMIAGVHRDTDFALFDVTADVDLPCEEWQYLAGVVPNPKTLTELESCEFDFEIPDFSSFAYRILCARNLGKFFRSQPVAGPDDPALSSIEALLAHWRLYLPASKRDAIAADGTVDEMMFQAHMMINATSILIHYPHSQLDSTPSKRIDSCAPAQHIPSGLTFNSHTRHVILAADEISKLITPTADLLRHTPFFICVVTLSSIVHLNRWGLHYVLSDENDTSLRRQISLNVGALSRISQVWASAGVAKEQVRSVAQGLSHARKQQDEEIQSGLWNDIFLE